MLIVSVKKKTDAVRSLKHVAGVNILSRDACQRTPYIAASRMSAHMPNHVDLEQICSMYKYSV